MTNKYLGGFRCAWAGAVFLGAVFLLSGCVSEPVEPMYIPKLAVAQSSNGTVVISWPSKVGYRYRLFACKENGKAVAYEKPFIGTGDIIEFKFAWKSDRPLPMYSILPEKIEE